MLKRVMAAIAALCLVPAVPASADEYFAVTPSGATEASFDASVVDTSDMLASKCIDLGWTVISTTDTVVVCEAPMSFGQSFAGQLLMGNSYSTPPRSFYRFNIANMRGVSRVQASGWMELQMAFGQTRRTDYIGPPFHNGAINFMTAAGGRLPPGTTFPNHVVMGIEILQFTKDGAIVKSVEPGSPAEAAGIQAGDTIRRLAGERVKDEADWMDGAVRATREPTYEIEYMRSGKKTVAALNRLFRPTVSAPDPVIAEGAPTDFVDAPLAETNAPFSVADELAKFAELHDSGVLTDAEFEAQKARLLGQ